MATVAAVPRINQTALSHSARMRMAPTIKHPMAKLGVGDRSGLKISGSASLDTWRPRTMASLPTLAVASSFSWSDFDVNATPRRRRYKKRSMATASKSEEEFLEQVTEHVVHSYEGIKRLFKAADRDGKSAITRDQLQDVINKILGYVSHQAFDRMLENLGLDKKEKITFDIFMSRFKEFKDIRTQWTQPVAVAADAERSQWARPEEDLRDIEPNEYAALVVAPQALYRLTNALNEKNIDIRSILPDECFKAPCVVTKLQMRVALQEMGVNLTDLEYKRFWDRWDKRNQGYLPRMTLYALLDLDNDGVPNHKGPALRKPVLLRAHTSIPPPRDPAKAAREFKKKAHKNRDPDGLMDGLRGAGLRAPITTPHVGDDGEADGKDSPATDAAARSKIRGAMLPQTGVKRLDNVVDCLHQKFEERYTGMNSAFRLFDIHNDGCVMRLDFRRVITEFNFPVAALQLPHLISRLGLSITHGLISYQRILKRLMNRCDGLTSTILDERITALTKGGGLESAGAGDSDEDVTVRKMVEFLHQDYIKLASSLLTADRSNTGGLTPTEFKAHVERCLSYPLTERQWEDLLAKLPYDAEGNVRYIDFMLTFNGGDPGKWNQLQFSGVTVPRNNLTHDLPEEFHRLERTKSEMPAKPETKWENRPVDVLRKDLVTFFTDHLHDVDREFKLLDRKSHKRFSKWQFGALLKLCGFRLTEHELGTVWLSLQLDADCMSTFNNVVMEFAPNFTPFRPNQGVTEDGGQAGGAAKGSPIPDGGGSPGGSGKAAPCQQPQPADPQPVTPVTPNTRLAHTMSTVAPLVRQHFDSLRTAFRNYDPHGFGTINFRQMQFEVDKLQSGLSPKDRFQLCAQFDFKSIGRCNYLAFMKAFAEPSAATSKLVYSPHTHKMDKKDRIPRRAQRQPKDEDRPITVTDAFIRMRSKLIKNWKNLRRGFQKHDKSRSGKMTVIDFKRILRETGIPVSEEDLFHILSEFDSNMNGLISYQEFLNTLLKMGAQ